MLHVLAGLLACWWWSFSNVRKYQRALWSAIQRRNSNLTSYTSPNDLDDFATSQIPHIMVEHLTSLCRDYIGLILGIRLRQHQRRRQLGHLSSDEWRKWNLPRGTSSAQQRVAWEHFVMMLSKANGNLSEYFCWAYHYLWFWVWRVVLCALGVLQHGMR